MWGSHSDLRRSDKRGREFGALRTSTITTGIIAAYTATTTTTTTMTVDEHITDDSLAAVLETSRAAREQALALVDLVAETSQAAGNGALSSEALATLSKQQKLLITHLAHLRGLHRSAHFRARETKAQTAEARHEVDVLHLQLQNLYYEQRHLEGEILACESFELVPNTLHPFH